MDGLWGRVAEQLWIGGFPTFAGAVVGVFYGEAGERRVVLSFVAAEFEDYQVKRRDDIDAVASGAALPEGVFGKTSDVAVVVVVESSSSSSTIMILGSFTDPSAL